MYKEQPSGTARTWYGTCLYTGMKEVRENRTN